MVNKNVLQQYKINVGAHNILYSISMYSIIFIPLCIPFHVFHICFHIIPYIIPICFFHNNIMHFIGPKHYRSY